MNTPAGVAAADAALDSKWKKCAECGALLSNKAEHCPKCGVGQSSGLSKTVLLLLVFFGGGIGLHKFYLRKPVQGIFYVLFCWTFIPSLIALVEMIVYACTSEARLREKYQASSSTSVIVIAAAAVFAFVAIIGILAAVSIPAYHDYTLRAKVMAVTQQVEPLRLTVESHIAKTGALPADPAEIPGIAPLKLSNLATAQAQSNGVIVIQFDQLAGKPVAGTTLELTPYIENNRVQWRCVGGNLPDKYRSPECRVKSAN